MMVFGIDFDLGLARVRAHPVLSRTKTVVEPVNSSSSDVPADKFSGIGFASQPNPVSQVNCPPSAAPTAGAYCPFSDASPFSNTYLYDYLLKQGLFEVARLFVINGADLELAEGPKARISVAANPILNIHKRRQSDGSLDFSSSNFIICLLDLSLANVDANDQNENELAKEDGPTTTSISAVVTGGAFCSVHSIPMSNAVVWVSPRSHIDQALSNRSTRCGGRNGKGRMGKGGAGSAPGVLRVGFWWILQDFEEEGVTMEGNGWRHWKEGQKLGGGAHQGRSGWSKTTGVRDL
ncbi:hypothetical protein PPACK8108_LOCUS15568 [Phakopsora pachyrhizi]|uniref:LisH domain-containing protein n=1 Tax=Phakopsora pachyrhizi TaxID=170000 RepID=A0AAV0BA11_PHAPC|nr:hypothetical protein PPACK8108_LOCUS15568 [Phakopsora pachyrhizi]